MLRVACRLLLGVLVIVVSVGVCGLLVVVHCSFCAACCLLFVVRC